jgi:hypothetical protein
MSHKAHTLDQMEKWLLELIRHPHDVETAIEDQQCKQYQPEAVNSIGDAILPSKYLSSEERLGIYANMYFWRLIDVLGDTFEVVRKSIGDDRFHDLAKAYLQVHPSKKYTLGELGLHFEAFIADYDEEELPERDFLKEMARLEWSINTVFSAARSEHLDVDQLVKIPNDAWATARFETVKAFDLHAFRYSTNLYWQQFHNEEEPAFPPEKQASHVVVVRRDYVVWRYDIRLEQYTLLKAFNDGKSLNEALIACAELPGIDFADLTSSLTAWFQEWTADGFFSQILIEDSSSGGK